jgi:hypothetical protein
MYPSSIKLIPRSDECGRKPALITVLSHGISYSLVRHVALAISIGNKRPAARRLMIESRKREFDYSLRHSHQGFM